MSARTPNYIFYLAADWETFHRPDMIYAFAEALRGRGGRLLCIDRLLCPLTTPLRGWMNPMTGPSRGVRKWAYHLGRRLGRRNPIEELSDNFYLARAFVALDDRFAARSKRITAMNRWLLRYQVTSFMRRLKFDDRPLVTWFHFPLWEPYVGMLDERFSVYECYDQHTATPGMSRTLSRAVSEAEVRLFAKVDLAFTTARTLLDAKRKFHRHIYHVPNAANVSFFSQVQQAHQRPDPRIASLSRPIVGYLGTIHDHTDVPLIRYIAEQRPDWTLVLIGKVDQRSVAYSPDFRRLQRMKNVHVLGWVDKNRLLSICKSFDVGIIPYRQDSEFNRFVNPNKLHEYTAMGKPVVALKGSELASHRDIVWLANDRDEFLDAIQTAYRTDSPERIRRRLRIAAENSWESRVRQMQEKVDELIASSIASESTHST